VRHERTRRGSFLPNSGIRPITPSNFEVKCEKYEKKENDLSIIDSDSSKTSEDVTEAIK
jgi:hypothetical protein